MSLSAAAKQHCDELLQRFPELGECRAPLALAVEAVCEAHRRGGKLLVCGNGGSAADSEHIVGELAKGFRAHRGIDPADDARLREAAGEDAELLCANLQRGLCALTLVSHTALATAVLNDLDPAVLFAQQVYSLGRPGDVLLGISTSGNSRNVVLALRCARAMGLRSIGLCGEAACAFDRAAEIVIKAPASETFRVQEYHLPLYHALCAMIETELWGDA